MRTASKAADRFDVARHEEDVAAILERHLDPVDDAELRSAKLKKSDKLLVMLGRAMMIFQDVYRKQDQAGIQETLEDQKVLFTLVARQLWVERHIG